VGFNIRELEVCLGEDVERLSRVLVRALGFRSIDDMRALRNLLGPGPSSSRLARRFTSRKLVRRSRGVYQLTGLGFLVLNTLDVRGEGGDKLLSIFENVDVRGECSKALLVASLLVTASTLDLIRLQELYNDRMLGVLARKSMQALGLGAIMYTLTPPLSGDEAHSVTIDLARIIGVNPIAVEECKSILWKAIARAGREEEAEITSLLEKAIAEVNRSVHESITVVLGSVADYACTIAKERGERVRCEELEGLVEKVVETIGRLLGRT
jgi:hypothetical protein